MGRRKKINGRKRHLICDHRSLVLLVMVTPANAQDSLVARELLFRLALMHPEIAIGWADSAYAKNGLIPWAKKYLDITVKTVLWGSKSHCGRSSYVPVLVDGAAEEPGAEESAAL